MWGLNQINYFPVWVKVAWHAWFLLFLCSVISYLWWWEVRWNRSTCCYIITKDYRDFDLYKSWSDLILLELGLRNCCLCSHNSCSNNRSINLRCSGQSRLFLLCYLRMPNTVKMRHADILIYSATCYIL